jgi:hypothetical protein
MHLKEGEEASAEASSGAGNGVTELVYTVGRGSTWLVSDENDTGVLDGTDFALEFQGRLSFTEADFSDRTGFIRAGTPGDDDVIHGLDSNDRISGLVGNDQLHGENGSDRLEGGAGFDELFGGEGSDTLTLQASDFGGNAYGGAGDDLVTDSAAAFSLSWLEGGAGGDVQQAGQGAPSWSITSGEDRLEGCRPEPCRPHHRRHGPLGHITSVAGRLEVVGFGQTGTAGRISADDFIFV